MVSAHDVAQYILSKFDEEISTWKMQKLLFYSQAWNLAWDEKPLFEENIEAWANGPVVRELYTIHQGTFSVAEWPDGDKELLDKDEKETVDAVIEGYGKLTGHEISEIVKNEFPWLKARKGIPYHERGSSVIDLEDIYFYYAALAASEHARTPVELFEN